MKKPQAAGAKLAESPGPRTRRVLIEVDAGLYDEVTALLKSPPGVTLFGKDATTRSRAQAGAAAWLKNLTFALPPVAMERRDA